MCQVGIVRWPAKPSHRTQYCPMRRSAQRRLIGCRVLDHRTAELHSGVAPESGLLVDLVNLEIADAREDEPRELGQNGITRPGVLARVHWRLFSIASGSRSHANRRSCASVSLV